MNAISALEKTYACPNPRTMSDLKPFRTAWFRLKREILRRYPRLAVEPDPVHSWVEGIEGERQGAPLKEQAAILSEIGL